jgi:hypothetical protein
MRHSPQGVALRLNKRYRTSSETRKIQFTNSTWCKLIPLYYHSNSVYLLS